VAEYLAPVPSILLVEGNDKHALLVQGVLKILKETILLYRVANVDRALRFLSRSDKYKLVPEPSLLLLNIEMPRRSGYDVLAEIYRDPSLTHIPVVVLSASDTFRDKSNSLSRGAFAHIGKPHDYQGYREVLRDIVRIIPHKAMAAAQ
jgi:CheY-like chemotaxis protein